ncbi:LysM peptidoglycan-binding domain-containing protein [Halalkalibaculum sp. DA3122]|uniref:CIS tube protein n=1 Tax=unclassified Halalkalibaculum TaxID=2964617 RepID=UPI003753FAA1
MAAEESNTGELKKLKIKSFKDAEYNQEDDEFSVTYNPQEYSVKYEIESDSSQGIGTTGTAHTFKKIRPQDLTLDFTLDGTGVTTGEKVDVPDKIREFLTVTYEFKGDEHRPRYLMVLWGTLIFKCILKSSSVKYTMFSNDGKPLRAKINATFNGFIEDNLRAAKEDKSSPDLTHHRVVNDGDSLPLMCYRIYGDSRYYLKVAEKNNLQNFRKLESGTILSFPPLGE